MQKALIIDAFYCGMRKDEAANRLNNSVLEDKGVL